jgi:hypothetical protein
MLRAKRVVWVVNFGDRKTLLTEKGRESELATGQARFSSQIHL